MGETPWWNAAQMSGDEYDARFAALERSGMDMHGEADFVQSLGVRTVLDAGCGTGRVAIELGRRGLHVAGVDRDQSMLRVAQTKAPHISWYLTDLATCTLSGADAQVAPLQFEAIVLAGNVMIFLDPGTEATVMANLARHLAPRGFLIAGFQLQPNGLRLQHYDACAASAGLELLQRWATWDKQPWQHTCDYAVSVHAKSTT
jgi:SAM-dependent methyltransferase